MKIRLIRLIRLISPIACPECNRRVDITDSGEDTI